MTSSRMIQSFADKDTERLFHTEANRRFSSIARIALRKLIQMNRARVLQDLAVPPGNHLEALRGTLAGFHPIRVNDQWRIVFQWTEAGPAQVAIVDYHWQTPVTLYVMAVKTPITPGEILLEDYLKPMGLSQNAIARALGVPPRAINEIVLGKRAITPTMSIRLGVFFGQSDDFWHGIQVECDFRALARKRKALVANMRPVEMLSVL